MTQLAFPFGSARLGRLPERAALLVGRVTWTVEFVRHPRARHYILRCLDPSTLRVTVPRGGSAAEAERFVRGRASWLERERYRMSIAARPAVHWRDGTRILFRGVETPLAVRGEGPGLRVSFADQELRVARADESGLRPAVEAHLWRMAKAELPSRLAREAARLGARVTSVSVRNQRSRWGSCSPSGHVSLNWRLIQMPSSVADYILVHELVHLSIHDHSRRFWRAVERACPGFREARAWIRTHQAALDARVAPAV